MGAKRWPAWLIALTLIALPGCGSGGNSSTATPAPTVTISSSSASMALGASATLTWSSTNAVSCTASGAWTGAQNVDGSLRVTPTTAGSLTYTLTCSGTGGSAAGSATIAVSVSTLPLTNTFSPNATTISTSEGAPYADCDFWVQSASSCTAQSNFGYGPTKVLRLYICLSGEVSGVLCSQEPEVTGPLSTAMLNDMNSRLAAYAGTGVRLLLCFIYNFGPVGPGAMDAPINVISENIDQIAPILLQNQDLIFSMEAGFIGTWGEWHDSTNGNDTPAAQATVLDKESSYFGGVFPILVRYPGDLIQYTGTSTPSNEIGLYDAYYASDSDDGGTWDTCSPGAGYCLSGYTVGQLQSYAEAVSTTTVFQGEFGAEDSTLQTCDALASYSYTYHPQSFALFPYPTAIATELQDEGCALSFYNQIGTRIELQNVTISGNPTANGQLQFSVTLVNTGYGRVIRQRPATLVFLSAGSVVAQIPIPLSQIDLRQLASSATPVPQTFAVNVTLPATFPSSGPVSVSLWMPDPAPSLTAQPAYALPLNSLDQSGNPIFNPATGYNVMATFAAN
jgi:Domain of unknown function (DUF4874)/Domain of unknown function (DUF4832)